MAALYNWSLESSSIKTHKPVHNGTICIITVMSLISERVSSPLSIRGSVWQSSSAVYMGCELERGTFWDVCPTYGTFVLCSCKTGQQALKHVPCLSPGTMCDRRHPLVKKLFCRCTLLVLYEFKSFLSSIHFFCECSCWLKTNPPTAFLWQEVKTRLHQLLFKHTLVGSAGWWPGPGWWTEFEDAIEHGP